MSAPTSPAQRPRRSRKSIAHIPSSSSALDQENNMSSARGSKSGKKSRSKSLGPGGLEALKEGTGNSQKMVPAIRSILKPIIPLSPPKPIPPRTPKASDSNQSSSAGSPSRRTRSSLGRTSGSPSAVVGSDNKSNTQANDSGEPVSVRTEEEQQAAARARDRAEAIKRRDERRKSLANRRVSFAPEATLHTWDVVELNEDATTSSEATNSTRRQSNGNTLGSDFTHGTQHPPSDPAEAPSTPANHDDEVGTPERDNTLPQMPKRRNSGIPSTDPNIANELSSSPGSIMDDDNTQSSFITNPEEIEDDLSDTDTYRDDESTAMDIDEDEATGNSAVSMRTDETSSSSSSAQLDARLRAAIHQAGTQRLDHIVDTGRVSQPDETTSITNAIRQKRRNENLLDADFAADHSSTDLDEEQTGAMEMTQAVGGIVRNATSRSPSRRNSRTGARISSGVGSNADDQTMDMTTAVGGIRRASLSSRRDSVATVATEDEDMSMELTGVIGGMLDQGLGFAAQRGPAEQTAFDEVTGQMEVTTALGRILSPVTERTEPSTEASASMDFTTAVGTIKRSVYPQEDSTATMDTTSTMTMDVTQAMGRILPAALRSSDRTIAKRLMEEETEHGQLTRSPLTKQPSYPELPAVDIAARTPSASPSHVQPATPTTGGRLTTPPKAANTPQHQITPQPAVRPTTPSKTPPNRNIAMRRTSPRKLFSQSTSERKAPSASPVDAVDANHRRATIDPANMNITLTPQLRRLSGRGADQAGLGSPKVAALLDRRTSIGDTAENFTPQQPHKRGVKFADPRELEEEIDKQRAEDRLREGESKDDKDNTMSLRDMIQTLTPKKKTFKARKSLAVGSARGLLGKRPIELDEAEEESPKRLQGPDRSPVKSIKLPAPPSKEETIGRPGKGPRFSLGPVSGNANTLNTDNQGLSKAAMPRDQQRFRDAGTVSQSVEPPVSFSERATGIAVTSVEDDSFEAIQLQDFLNIINVRFMDLETTKRRHTLAPRDRTSSETASDERRLDDCVVAGVSTVPMLELYQHSCRELKKYISEGRNIVREIEVDTGEENPQLFREYMSAASDVRAIMDNQFKNVKCHARLLSRAMWYEWRMKLLDGLKDGLIKIAEGLVQDSDILSRQESILDNVVPGLLEKSDELTRKETELRKQANEFEISDQDELQDVRQQLIAADAEWEEKKRILAELRAEKAAQDGHLERLQTRKEQCLSEIAESQKLCDEYRGWKMSEVAALKAEVDSLASSTGWTIASAADAGLEMHYRNALSLFLRPGSFQPASADPSTIRLALASDSEPNTQERFFLQLLRARLHMLDQASTPISEVLNLVSSGWDVAMRLRSSVSDMTLSYITDVAITGDESLAVSANILLREMRTKVQVKLELKVGGVGTQFSTSVRTAAHVVYGEELKEGRMGDFLASKLGDAEEQGFGRWSEAVRELETRLIARGKK